MSWNVGMATPKRKSCNLWHSDEESAQVVYVAACFAEFQWYLFYLSNKNISAYAMNGKVLASCHLGTLLVFRDMIKEGEY